MYPRSGPSCFLVRKVYWPADGGKALDAGNHHIVVSAGTVDDEQIAALVPTAHNAHMGVLWVEYQIAGERLIPGNGGAVSVLTDRTAAVSDYAYGNGYGQQREDELAEREPEKQAFLIVSDFFVDAYLDWISPPFLILDFRQTGTCHVCRGMLTSN